MTATIEHSVEANIAGVIQLLAEYTTTGKLSAIAKARHIVTDLHHAHVDVAMPLWKVTIALQRAYSERDE